MDRSLRREITEEVQMVSWQMRCECCERIIHYGLGNNIREIKGKKEHCTFCRKPRFTDTPVELK